LEWLRANQVDVGTPAAAELNRVCVVAEEYAQRCRPEGYAPPVDPDPPVYTPAPDTYQGAVMYAARILRRRNSPAGVESFGDLGVTFVAKWDGDIERMLRTGGATLPGVG
jgi:hypothetical protein